jgi:SAM-dependent methyltransferase
MMDPGFSSSTYWEARYSAGGTSGAGSYGRLAAFKAAFVNAIVADNQIRSVLDLGCGDGNFLSLLDIPAYTGIDVSPTTLVRCSDRFASRSNYTFLSPEQLGVAERTELALSIDVIFHLVEDDVFRRHIDRLFDHATRFVLIYASNFDSAWPARHVRHRRFSTQVAALFPDWHLLAHLPNRFPYNATRPDDTSFSDFFLYGRTSEGCVIRLPAV